MTTPSVRSSGLSTLALVSLAVAATATVALAAWTVAPQLRAGEWRWGALALDTVGLACAGAAYSRIRSPQPELLTLAAAVAAYAAAVSSAVRDLSPAAFVTSGLTSLLAAVVGAMSGVIADLTGPRPWPRLTVPIVVAVALVVLLAHGAAAGWHLATVRAGLATLIACAPAALAVAVLGPLLLGSRRMLRGGVRLADTSAIAASTRVRTLVLDGLATLVKGKHVSSVDPIEESHLRNLRWFAGALGHAAQDDVGRAIAKLSTRGALADVERHPGLGISGSVDRHPVRVGEPTWIGLTATDGPGVTVAVEVDARLLGTITVSDTVRPTATGAVAALAEAGVEPVLVTGAAPVTAAAVAAEAGVGTVIARLESDPIGGAVAARAAQAGTVAILSPTYASPVSSTALLLGPASTQLIVQECEVQAASVALATCRAMARAIHRATPLAVGLQLATAVLAALGLLPPWTAALVGLAGSALLWGLVRRHLPTGEPVAG